NSRHFGYVSCSERQCIELIATMAVGWRSFGRNVIGIHKSLSRTCPVDFPESVAIGNNVDVAGGVGGRECGVKLRVQVQVFSFSVFRARLTMDADSANPHRNALPLPAECFIDLVGSGFTVQSTL